MFDPYHKWLGIPKDQRPPTLYQLLGVAPAEDDADVIEEAAIRQTAHVRTYQTGPYAQDCARLLKEIALARVTLLNPVKRQAYDASLRPVPSTTAVGDTDGAAFDPLADLGDGSLISSPSSARLRRTPRKKSWVKGLLFGGMLHLLAGAAVVWFFFLRPKQPAGPKPDDTKTAHVAAVVQGQEGAAPKRTPAQSGGAAESKATERARPRPGDNHNRDVNGRPLGLPPSSGQPKPDDPNQPDPPIKKEPTPAGTIKTPVPPDAKVALARKAIRDLYQRKFEQLKPGARVPFVKELLQRAREAYEERAEKFAYYLEARDLAIQDGAVAEALESVEALALWFDVNRWTLRSKVLDELLTKESPVINQAVGENALTLFAEAVDEDNLPAAQRFVKQAETAALKAKSPALEKKVTARVQEWADIESQYRKVEEARARLRDQPTDPEANLALGKHLCLRQGDWEKGLPLLAQGADPALKQLAEKDLSRPPEASDRQALGEAWLTRAKKETAKPRRHLLARAGYWFKLTASTATGVVRAQADKSSKEVASLTARSQASKLTAYAGRSGRTRERLFREGGGTEQSDVAVARGLHWLAQNQAANGAWPKEKPEVAATALALLAFLGDGHTHTRVGIYRENVTKAIHLLRADQTMYSKNQFPGYFGGGPQAHALATLAICEAYGLTKDPDLKLVAQSALQFIVRPKPFNKRSKDFALWGQVNTLIVGCQVMALKGGELAGLEIVEKALAFRNATNWLNSCAKDDGAQYGSRNDRDGDQTTSALGLLCRVSLGWDRDQPALSAGVSRLKDFPPKFSRSPYYCWFATQLLYHWGGEPWEFWNSRFREYLVSNQEKGEPQAGGQAGSWDPMDDVRLAEGGRSISTALAILSLEVYYRQPPLLRKGLATEAE